MCSGPARLYCKPSSLAEETLLLAYLEEVVGKILKTALQQRGFQVSLGPASMPHTHCH